MMHRLRFSFVLILFGCIGVAGVGSPASVQADSVRFGLSVDSGYQPTSLVRRGHHRFTRHKNHPLRVIPRIGFRRHVLPIGHVRIVIGGASFYVHGGVFYQQARSGFVVVKAPYGSVITTLPVGYTVVHRGSGTYFVCDGIFFRMAHGKRGYIVVKNPEP